jgi:hypothetical protein
VHGGGGWAGGGGVAKVPSGAHGWAPARDAAPNVAADPERGTRCMSAWAATASQRLPPGCCTTRYTPSRQPGPAGAWAGWGLGRLGARAGWGPGPAGGRGRLGAWPAMHTVCAGLAPRSLGHRPPLASAPGFRPCTRRSTPLPLRRSTQPATTRLGPHITPPPSAFMPTLPTLFTLPTLSPDRREQGLCLDRVPGQRDGREV